MDHSKMLCVAALEDFADRFAAQKGIILDGVGAYEFATALGVAINLLAEGDEGLARQYTLPLSHLQEFFWLRYAKHLVDGARYLETHDKKMQVAEK
jgi:hypothetical protein